MPSLPSCLPWFAAALALAAACTPCRAAYTLSRTALVASGASGATAPPYRLAASVAQPAAGQMIGGAYGLWTGFLWPRATPTAGAGGEHGGPPITRLAWRPAMPNPAFASTTLSFELPGAADVRVSVYSVDGRRIATPFAGRREAGRHSLAWDCRDAAGHRLAPGVYLAVLEAGPRPLTQRLVVLDR